LSTREESATSSMLVANWLMNSHLQPFYYQTVMFEMKCWRNVKREKKTVRLFNYIAWYIIMTNFVPQTVGDFSHFTLYPF
jgi:hypothetical protein